MIMKYMKYNQGQKKETSCKDDKKKKKKRKIEGKNQIDT